MSLTKNPYVITLAGKEGAKKLGYIAFNNRKNPYLDIPNSRIVENKAVKKVAGIVFQWDWFRLDVEEYDFGYVNGSSFRVVEKIPQET